MPDQKISADAALAEASIDPNNDLIPIVDVSEAAAADRNKSVKPLFFRRFAWAAAFSDETTALTVGTSKVTFHMPFAMEVTAIHVGLSTPQTSGSIFTVDVNKNGATMLSTKITVDNGEETSNTAATPPVLSTTTLAAFDKITVDIDQVGDGTAKGGKVYIIGYLA